ncbi:MAG: hypothetical protein OEL76_17780 [Siculibacillus sp.]|nr:hypothetical protein [Siculibacillus sp.]
MHRHAISPRATIDDLVVMAGSIDLSVRGLRSMSSGLTLDQEEFEPVVDTATRLVEALRRLRDDDLRGEPFAVRDDHPPSGGGFLELLHRRAAIVKTIVGPRRDDDVPRLEQVADIERRLVANPPRTPDEIAEALAVVRSEISDGILGSDTIEEFLISIIDATAEFVTGHAVQRT